MNYLKKADFNVSDIATKEMSNEEWEKILNEMRSRGITDKDISSRYEKQSESEFAKNGIHAFSYKRRERSEFYIFH
ncbi:MAG: hypothetical protein U5L09_03245 [Bacteroidales bacterium]|nr:hypothetical protein [Bacteroidales bacterium]